MRDDVRLVRIQKFIHEVADLMGMRDIACSSPMSNVGQPPSCVEVQTPFGMVEVGCADINASTINGRVLIPGYLVMATAGEETIEAECRSAYEVVKTVFEWIRNEAIDRASDKLWAEELEEEKATNP